METSLSALTADQLLQHEQFLRSLAQGLLGDEHAARDLVQDTWLRALRRGPRAAASLRAWFRRVAANRARDIRRNQSRRAEREAIAARSEALPSIDATYERLALQREVVTAILGLAEPYKSVVILRYYHDLPPAEIAKRTHTKPSTVRTQLSRAHELLRTRLHPDDETRCAWLGLLGPIGGDLRSSAGSFFWKSSAALTASLLAVAWFGWPIAEDSVPDGSAGSSLGAMVLLEDETQETRSPVAERTVRKSLEQEPSPAPVPELIDPRAELRAQLRYEDRAYSFEYGASAKRSPKKTRNDWDVLLELDRLRACSVTDDQSLIVDLGAMELVELCQRPLDALQRRISTAAASRYAEGAEERPRPFEMQTIELGHTYFVWTLDTDTDLASLCTVVEHEPGNRCVLDWYSTEDGRLARGSVASPRGSQSLTSIALALRAAARAEFDRIWHLRDLVEPRVVLQARVGAIGGNDCRIDLASRQLGRFRRCSSEPLDLRTPIAIQEEAIAYRQGGRIPKGMKFVVTNITWSGEARGDSNGTGAFRIQLGEFEIVDAKPSHRPISGTWKGRVELLPGQESEAYFEVSNSSMGEVVFSGSFEKFGN
ncbi:MAG: sigma-70 family RNA polymerase sigma factor [Planctomycetes bacterium]|nr:sigma-70 family RNA polymerase sigma factor [Planctomycetota bacterium]